MAEERASIFGGDDVDISAFKPKQALPPAASPEQVREVAEGVRFRSREPQAPPVPQAQRREPRRHRTGRNVQLNIKARAEAVDAFYALADRQNWVLGEAFERAIEALQRELSQGKPSSG